MSLGGSGVSIGGVGSLRVGFGSNLSCFDLFCMVLGYLVLDLIL